MREEAQATAWLARYEQEEVNAAGRAREESASDDRVEVNRFSGIGNELEASRAGTEKAPMPAPRRTPAR